MRNRIQGGDRENLNSQVRIRRGERRGGKRPGTGLGARDVGNGAVIQGDAEETEQEE